MDRPQQMLIEKKEEESTFRNSEEVQPEERRRNEQNRETYNGKECNEWIKIYVRRRLAIRPQMNVATESPKL